MWPRDLNPQEFGRFEVAAVLFILFVLLYLGRG